MRYLALSSLVLLAGCATQEPLSVATPKEVLIPVPVACDIQVARPHYMLDNKEVLDLSLLAKCAACLSEIEQREAYEKQLEAAIKACKGD